MELNTWTTVLVAIAPALSSILTIIAAFIKNNLNIKKIINDNRVNEERLNAKMLKNYDNIAKINARLTSIEKYLIEEKEQKK